MDEPTCSENWAELNDDEQRLELIKDLVELALNTKLTGAELQNRRITWKRRFIILLEQAGCTYHKYMEGINDGK